jgi:hypothetical protein
MKVRIASKSSEVTISRTAFLKMVDEITRESHPGSCDLKTIFRNIKVVKSNGISGGSTLFANFNPTEALRKYIENSPSGVEVFIKVGNDHLGSLKQEAYAYAFVSQLITQKRSPNFMRVVMHFTCPNFKKTALAPLLDAKRGEDAEIIVLEKGRGKPLESIKNSLSPRAMLEIIFQLGYSLREMNIHGLRHNDMHLGNVWIDTISTKVAYRTPYGTFVMAPRVKIFDFDHSAFTFTGPKVPVNRRVTERLCPMHGECSSVNINQDFFKVVSNLDGFVTGKSRAMIHKIYSKMMSKYKYKPKGSNRSTSISTPFLYPDMICKKVKKGKSVVCSADSTLPREILGFEDLLRDGVFDELKTQEKVSQTFSSTVL